MRPSGVHAAGHARHPADAVGVRLGPVWRWAIVAAAAVVLFVLAVNGDVYAVASPPALSWHVVLRKAESIVAFAVLGALYAFATPRSSVAGTAFFVAIYSGAIEIGQWFVTDETLVWNLVDVVCGAAGGALGAVALSRRYAAPGR